MNEFFEQIGSELREFGHKIKASIDKLLGKTPDTSTSSVANAVAKTSYEINLVPDVKMQMIRAQKTRNLVLFMCIVISSVAVGVVVVLFGIKSGQDIAMANQDNRLEQLSIKLNEYGELDSLLTIQNQLAGISEINDQKTVVARVFGALGVMLPQGSDSVQLSELSVDTTNNLIQMEGQADAHVDPLIDYRVLESFKKGVSLTKYDYGRYVDSTGREIPTYCIKEADAEGNAYRTDDNNYYAWWDLQISGCEASQSGSESSEGAEYTYSSTAEVIKGIPNEDAEYEKVCDEENRNCAWQMIPSESGEQLNEGGEVDTDKLVALRVKVWRTPQFTAWLNAGRMTLEGNIDNVEHFESQCTTYRGTRTGESVRWTSTNDCMLVDEDHADTGLEILTSNNGRDESGNLVLKFTARTTFAKDFFAFANKHMIAIGPLGQNVTDSYVQIGYMFTEEASECSAEDTECLDNLKNTGGQQ